MSNLAKRRDDMGGYLERHRATIQKSLPKLGVTADRFVQMAMMAMDRQPKLYDCTGESLVRCLMLSAQTGLMPTGRGGMWLVPFGREATPIIDYRGLLNIARRSGQVTRTKAAVVREGDVFEWEEGTEPFLRHRALSDVDQKVTHVYAIAHMKDGPPVFVVLTRVQVERFRSRAKASRSGPWQTDWDAMAMKTAARRLCEWLPMQDEDQRIVEIASRTERGEGVQDMLPPMDTVNVTDDVTVGDDAPPADEPLPEVGGVDPDDLESGRQTELPY